MPRLCGGDNDRDAKKKISHLFKALQIVDDDSEDMKFFELYLLFFFMGLYLYFFGCMIIIVYFMKFVFCGFIII